ncbi:hypothetical protein K8R42_01930, partial [bacterium]|nr:hypothetical protein [bacterium]
MLSNIKLKNMKKTILLTLMAFILSLFQASVIKASPHYAAGSLLALEGVDGAAVYYIGSDGNKYVFPDGKTYGTWYDNFDDVVRVDVAELDNYPDGGAITYRPGTKLITHENTAKIYAVGSGGALHWIPTTEVAETLYGETWYTRVMDVLPGYFSSSYEISNNLSNMYPEGTLLKMDNDLYYVEDNAVRLFVDIDVFEANNFNYNNIMEVDDISVYSTGESITGEEVGLSGYMPIMTTGCTYNNILGTAEIISIESAPAEEYNCSEEPKKIVFEFTPNDLEDRENYRFPNVSDTANLTI